MQVRGQSEASARAYACHLDYAAPKSDQLASAGTWSSHQREAEVSEKSKRTTKSTFSASVWRSNFKLSCSHSHTRICGLYVPVAIICSPSRVNRTLLLAMGNSKSWISSILESSRSFSRAPFLFFRLLDDPDRLNMSGKEVEL